MAFNLFDQSGDGEISTDELGDVFKSLGQDLSTQELNRLSTPPRARASPRPMALLVSV